MLLSRSTFEVNTQRKVVISNEKPVLKSYRLWLQLKIADFQWDMNAFSAGCKSIVFFLFWF